MKKKSGFILLLGPQSLLYEGISSLLANETDFQVSTMNYSEPEIMLRDIDQIKPDVFLFCEASPVDRDLTTELLHKVLARRETHAIVIRQDDNIIDVYNKNARPARDLYELLALLEAGPLDSQRGTRLG
jgi:DNA-binding NarL/FixJ family response regulator